MSLGNGDELNLKSSIHIQKNEAKIVNKNKMVEATFKTFVNSRVLNVHDSVGNIIDRSAP